MTLETRRSGWIRIAVRLTALFIAVGATRLLPLPPLPRERAWGADPAYRFAWPRPPQYPEAPEAQASASGRVA